MKLNHTELVTRSFRLPWEVKGLWILGILIALGGGGGGGGGGQGPDFNFNRSFPSGEEPPLPNLPDLEVQLERLLPLFIGLACLVLLLAVALTVLRFVARAGLIRAAVAADAGEAVSWRQGLAWGWSRWAWRHFLQGLIVWGLLLLPVAILLGFGFAATVASFRRSPPASAAILLPFLCLLVPLILLLVAVGIVFSVWLHLARRAVVLEDRGVLDGLVRGWDVLRGNLGDVALLVVISFGVALAWGILSLLILLPLLALFLGPGLALLLVARRFVLGFVVLLLGLFGLGLLMAVPGGYLSAFQETYWTLAYRELTAGEA